MESPNLRQEHSLLRARRNIGQEIPRDILVGNRKRKIYVEKLRSLLPQNPSLHPSGHEVFARGLKKNSYTPGIPPPVWKEYPGLVDSTSGLDQQQAEAWLASSINWAPEWNFGPRWVGRKVLGVGGFGLVGLWENTTEGPDLFGPVLPKRIVVKQSKGPDRLLQDESKLLQQCKNTRTNHIVKLLGSYHEDVGQATSNWDRGDTLVSRIYLEFCESGDLAKFTKSMHQ